MSEIFASNLSLVRLETAESHLGYKIKLRTVLVIHGIEIDHYTVYLLKGIINLFEKLNETVLVPSEDLNIIYVRPQSIAFLYWIVSQISSVSFIINYMITGYNSQIVNN